jgi:general secretion pathway protein H
MPSTPIEGGNRFADKGHAQNISLSSTAVAAQRSARAGFTLIEVLAVMLIVALVASLAVTIVPGTGRAKLKALALETAALLRRQRIGAMLTGHERRVGLDGARRMLVADSGDVVRIPGDVTLDVLGVDERWAGRGAVVGFHPDGASTGVVLRLARERAAYDVRVNWYSGAVDIVAP